jgi:hypothetical protein
MSTSPRPTKAELSALSKLGAKKGGKARWAGTTTAERAAHAKAMNAARWGKKAAS